MSVGELRPPPVEDPLVGSVVSDRYRILKKIGEGGMGTVYLAQHVFIEKKVALKVLAPELARRQDLAMRFLQEAKSASRIGHENVIDISDFSQTPEGLVFFAMEFLEGVDLGGALRQDGPMPWTRAKPIVLQVCRALRAAHNNGIVHRDMKPENVFLIQREGRPDFVKLLDFGIAKVIGGTGADAPKLTATGMIFGTPEYMAPEQAEGKEADHRVDIYAVGCVIYHLVTGGPPFVAETFMGMLTKHLLEEPVLPSARRPDLGLTADMDALVKRALQKDREQRFGTMDEMIAAIEACSGQVAEGRSGAASPAAARMTKPMGGGDKESRAQFRTPSTARDAAELAADDAMVHVASRGAPKWIPLAALGVGLGVAVAAIWLVVGGGGKSAGGPVPVAQPAPAPLPVAAPGTPTVVGAGEAAAPGAGTAPAMPPASATEPPRAKPTGARDRGAKRERAGTWRRVGIEDVTAPPDPAPKPAAPAPTNDSSRIPGVPTPSGLKPFPQ